VSAVLLRLIGSALQCILSFCVFCNDMYYDVVVVYLIFLSNLYGPLF
jgi:hypothetical protein